MLLLAIAPTYAVEPTSRYTLPPIEVIDSAPKTIGVDSVTGHRTDWEVPGLTLRTTGMNSSIRVGILGAPPGGTLLRIEGNSWNDPRNGLADLSEIPYWPVSRLSVSTGANTGAQGGVIDVTLQSPHEWQGASSVVKWNNENEFSAEFMASGGTKFPVGVSGKIGQKVRGSFPANDAFRRDRFAGNETYSLLFCSDFERITGTKSLLTLSLRSRENDLPGLVGRAVESGSYEQKRGGYLTFRSEGLLSIHARAGIDQSSYHRPAKQYSPAGIISFLPVSDQSQWRGGSLRISQAVKLPNQFLVQPELELTEDWIRTSDETTHQSIEVNRVTGVGKCLLTKEHPTLVWKPIWSIIGRAEAGFWQPKQRTEVQHSGAVSMALSPRKNIHISGSFGSTLRWPALNDLYLAPNIYVTGNPDLDPETATELHGDLDWIATEKFSFSAIGYTRNTTNGIVWKQNSRGQFVPRNVQATTSNGGTVKIVFTPINGFKLQLSGAKTDTRIATAGDINRGNQLPLIPMYQSEANIEYHSSWKHFQSYVSGRWFYQSRRYLLEANTDPLSGKSNDLPTESVTDFTVGSIFPIPSLGIESNLSLTVRNTFDRKRWALEGLPLPGRVFEISCQLTKR